MRIRAFGDLYWGPPFLGKLPYFFIITQMNPAIALKPHGLSGSRDVLHYEQDLGSSDVLSICIRFVDVATPFATVTQP